MTASFDSGAFYNTPRQTSGLRVLIVDDNVDAATMLGTLVGQWGHALATAKTAAEAIAIAEGFRPRVVLLDLGLPDMHGYDLAERLRRRTGNRVLHFIAVTGWSQIADQMRSSAAGITHHLVKPVNHEVLREVLAGYSAAEAKLESAVD